MLIKITNYCSMGCSHCMEDSTVRGEHMPFDTVLRALELTKRVERLAWQHGCLPFVLLSGGEATEHPDVVKIIEEIVRQGLTPMLITNGLWLGNQELKAAILRPEWPKLFVQVTHDARFYPTAPPFADDRRITYIPTLTHLVTLGRAARRKSLDSKGVPPKTAPTSFNFRSLTRALGSVEQAVAVLRLRAMVGKSGHCIPSISADGSVVAGETRFCFQIGTVDSSNDELTKATCAMRCNRCGLVDHLTPPQKRAIGEPTLLVATEP